MRREAVESVVNLLPIVLPFGVLGVMALDNGGIKDGSWDFTAVRINDQKRREEYSASSVGDLEKWLGSNTGGGKTNFEYTGYKKGGLELPEVSSDELLTPVPLILAVLLLAEITLAASSGVNSPTGFLGFASGQFMKGLFDVWNAVAPGVGLGGAILKY